MPLSVPRTDPIRALGCAVALGAALLALAEQSASAQTREVDADFSKYCRESFSNSAYQKRAQPWGIQHYCMQGGTLQGIALA